MNNPNLDKIAALRDAIKKAIEPTIDRLEDIDRGLEAAGQAEQRIESLTESDPLDRVHRDLEQLEQTLDKAMADVMGLLDQLPILDREDLRAKQLRKICAQTDPKRDRDFGYRAAPGGSARA